MTFEAPRGEDWRWADLSGVSVAAAVQPLSHAIDWRRFRVGNGPVWVLVDGRIEVTAGLGEAHGREGAPLTQGATAAGVALDLGPEHATTGLIEIIHIATGGAAHVAHSYTLAADAQASVIETYANAGDGPAWVNVAAQVDLGSGARLMRAVRRVVPAGVTVTETAEVRAGPASSYAATELVAGEGSARAEHQIDLVGAGAFASVDGVVLAAAGARLDVFNRFRHSVAHTTGRQTWRMVARDSAQASMIGRIEVVRDAQKTDAAQSIRGLLLDRTATINAKPELEIFADDVKAAHGCAIGALDRAALFYLAARGIDAARARALLTQAFVATPLEQAGDPVARTALMTDAAAWLEAQR